MIAHSRKVVRYFYAHLIVPFTSLSSCNVLTFGKNNKLKHENKFSATIFCFSAHLIVPLQPIHAVVARTSKLRE